MAPGAGAPGERHSAVRRRLDGAGSGTGARRAAGRRIGREVRAGGGLMFGIGGLELIAVLAIALLVFGPKRLPEVGRTLGKAARDFKGGLSEIEDVKSSMKVDVP